MEDDDGFQLNTVNRKKKVGGVRLYVGGLPSEGVSESSLKDWLGSRIPEGVEIGDIEFKASSKTAKRPSSFAFVECGGGKGINDIIRTLKQSDCNFQGNKLVLQREQRNNNNNKARQRSSNNHTGKRNAGFRNRPGGKTFSNGPSISARGWSKPTSFENPAEDWIENSGESVHEETPVTSIESASERIADVVSNEINMATDADDKINAAIASTAATTMMTSLMASLGFQEEKHRAETPLLSSELIASASLEGKTDSITDFASFAKGQTMKDLLDEFGEEDPDWKQKIIPEQRMQSEPKQNNEGSFASFVQGQNVAGLLADFGEADPDWKNKIVDETNCHNDDSGTRSPTASKSKPENKAKKEDSENHPSRLAMKGRAPIHLSIESFGFVHGAPSRKSRDRMGSPYTQPIGLLSVGDDVTEAVPTHLEFHDGLRSGVIKRMLKHAPLAVESESTLPQTDLLAYDKDEDDDENQDLSKYRDFSDYCHSYLAEICIFPSVIEAIHEGGHGYVSPLTMNFQIGSHLGRHRSVIAVELVAQHLRSLLRRNSQGKINCTVSVGTVHRDVGKRIPNKTYREDDDDNLIDKNDRV